MLPLVILLMAAVSLFAFVLIMFLSTLLGLPIASQLFYIGVVITSVILAGIVYLLSRKSVLKEKGKPNWSHIAIGAIIAAILIVGIPFIFDFLHIQSLFSQNLFSVESVTAQAQLYGKTVDPTILLLSAWKPQLYLACAVSMFLVVGYFAWTGKK